MYDKPAIKQPGYTTEPDLVVCARVQDFLFLRRRERVKLDGRFIDVEILCEGPEDSREGKGFSRSPWPVKMTGSRPQDEVRCFT